MIKYGIKCIGTDDAYFIGKVIKTARGRETWLGGDDPQLYLNINQAYKFLMDFNDTSNCKYLVEEYSELQ